MALVKCLACGALASDTATACAKCGASFTGGDPRELAGVPPSRRATHNTKRPGKGPWIIGAVVVVGILALAGQNRGTQSTTSPSPTAAPRVAEAAAPKPTAVPAAAPTAAPTPEPAPAAYLVSGAGADGVSLRKEPSTTGERLKLLKDGDRVADHGEAREAAGRTWRKVADAAAGEGWVAAEFLKDAPVLKPLPVNDPRWVQFTDYGPKLINFVSRSDAADKEFSAAAGRLTAATMPTLLNQANRLGEQNATWAREATALRTPNEAEKVKDAVVGVLRARQTAYQASAKVIGDPSVVNRAALEEAQKTAGGRSLLVIGNLWTLCDSMQVDRDNCNKTVGIEG